MAIASAKRKAEEKSVAAAKGKKALNDSARPAKRQRQEPNGVKEKALSKDVGAHPKVERKAPKLSLLQEEERSFPRGGGGVLTPLEHKQIQVQATRDALFEESGQKRAKPDDMGNDFDSQDEDGEEAKTAKSGRKTKTKSKKSGTVDTADSRIRVEGLKFKVHFIV